MIFEFLADPARNSLELPHMTTGQRKSVKKLVQNHPELRCESYGFGEDRQLHLFKTGPSETDQSHLTRASLAKISRPESRTCSPDSSTFVPSEASSESGKCGASSGSPASSNRDVAVQAMQDMMQVRNTFIHFECASNDERSVQSMPRNMFSQHILSESLQRACQSPEPAPEQKEVPVLPTFESEASAEQHTPVTPGALVVVKGLVKLPAFNGQSAIVQGWDESTGRYNIVVASAGSCQQAKIKRENLLLLQSQP